MFKGALRSCTKRTCVTRLLKRKLEQRNFDGIFWSLIAAIMGKEILLRYLSSGILSQVLELHDKFIFNTFNFTKMSTCLALRVCLQLNCLQNAVVFGKCFIDEGAKMKFGNFFVSRLLVPLPVWFQTVLKFNTKEKRFNDRPARLILHLKCDENETTTTFRLSSMVELPVRL